MCRKSQMRGWCMIAFSLGLILGYSLESWLLCCFGGAVLAALGFVICQQK